MKVKALNPAKMGDAAQQSGSRPTAVFAKSDA